LGSGTCRRPRIGFSAFSCRIVYDTTMHARTKRLIFGASLVLAALGWPRAQAHRKAYRLLTSLESTSAAPPVQQTDESLADVRGHWYIPEASGKHLAVELDGSLPTLVFVHGIQREGIDSPRLIRFARAFADQGFAVFTPQISELADYRLETNSIATIEAAIRYAQITAKRKTVGVFGISFGGGLALMASTKDPTAITFVGTLGGYGDANRVARFLLTGCAERRDGSCKMETPHDYGAVIFFYDYADEFFSSEDAPIAKTALRLWLHEKFDAAKEEAKKLSTAGAEKIELIFSKKTTGLHADVKASVQRHQADLTKISASNRAKEVTAPVFLLHAEGDPVVPDTEVEFLSAELPNVQAYLVSPALGHAELGHSTWLNKLALLHFIAELLRAAER
jgi:pimeloyl-ACP methyl ester carboxylesterase